MYKVNGRDKREIVETIYNVTVEAIIRKVEENRNINLVIFVKTHAFAQYITFSTLTFRSLYDSFSRRPRRTEGEIVRPAVMARNPIDFQAQIRDSGRCTRDFSPAPLTTKFSIAAGTLRILPMSRNFGDRKSSKSGLTLDISQLFKRVT